MGAIESATVEVLASFDWSGVSDKVREKVQASREAIEGFYRQTLIADLSIGFELMKVKAALPHGSYGKWIQSEFPYGATFALQCEWLAQRCEMLPNSRIPRILENFDREAAKILSSPKLPDEIWQSAVQMAESGQYVTHACAKALKEGKKHTLLAPGKTAIVQDETSPAHGKTVAIANINKRDGIVTAATEEGVLELPLSELLPPTSQPQTAPQAPQKMLTPFQLLAVDLEMANLRIEALEAILRRMVTAARLNALSDTLLVEAEEMLG